MTAASAIHRDADFMLGNILSALKSIQTQQDSICFDLTSLAANDRATIREMLGNGEVCIRAGAEAETEITETILPGVWHTQNKVTRSESIEVGSIPRIVRQINLSGTTVPASVAPEEGIMNGPAVLDEVVQALRNWQRGMDNHVINFTLMPLSPEDKQFLTHSLGLAPLEILARSYGACRILSAAMRGVWSVQYMNSEDKLILDTLEIGDVPLAAQAAHEDFEDSAARLHGMMIINNT